MHFLILGRSTEKKIGKRNLELGGPIPQHNIYGAWKQQGRAAYLLPPSPQQHRAAQWNNHHAAIKLWGWHVSCHTRCFMRWPGRWAVLLMPKIWRNLLLVWLFGARGKNQRQDKSHLQVYVQRGRTERVRTSHFRDYFFNKNYYLMEEYMYFFNMVLNLYTSNYYYFHLC